MTVPHMVSCGPPAISVKRVLLSPFCSDVPGLISYKVTDLVPGMAFWNHSASLIPAPSGSCPQLTPPYQCHCNQPSAPALVP